MTTSIDYDYRLQPSYYYQYFITMYIVKYKTLLGNFTHLLTSAFYEHHKILPDDTTVCIITTCFNDVSN